MSNTQYKHLLAFDLASYGAALAIINQYVDDSAVKVFEISPSGSSSTLILLSSDAMSLQVIKAQGESVFKSQVLASALVENIHPDLFPAYLSQNKTQLKNNLMVLEGNYVSLALAAANTLLNSGEALVDFRIIRTFPKNVMLTFTNSKTQIFESKDFKKTLIDNVQPVLKSYYEIN